MAEKEGTRRERKHHTSEMQAELNLIFTVCAIKQETEITSHLSAPEIHRQLIKVAT